MEGDHAAAHGYAVVGLAEQPCPSQTGQREVGGQHRRDATPNGRRPGHLAVTGPSYVLELAQASSSAATFLVRLGSTWTPGPMVVESVTLRM